MPEEHKNLRAYILNDIGDEARQKIEERLMTDEDFFRELSLVEETIVQDYADENLTAAERENFERCFLNSDENRQKVRFARALRKYVDETEPPKVERREKHSVFDSLKAFFQSPVTAAFALLLIVSVGGFFIWKSSRANDNESLLALNKAYRAERPLESRITGLDYAPTKNTRGADDKTDKIELELAKTLALKSVSENPNAENLHALGKVFLTQKLFDEAIEHLEKAAKLSPNDAEIHNDLGAAFLEKAGTIETGKLETLGKAKEEFAKAVELDKNLSDAYFNRALTIQTLNLSDQAREAWQKYLELDSSSKWADEARKNLELLENTKPISKTKEEVLQEFLEAENAGDHEGAWQTLSKNREMIVGKLIPQQLAFLFTDAKAAGNDKKASEHLASLKYAAKLEKERAGDFYWKDVADFYSDVSVVKFPILKEAQERVKEGNKMRASFQYKESLKYFGQAKTLFNQIQNNAEEKLCDYWIAVNLYQLNQISESDAICENLTKLGSAKRYSWLAAISHIRLALSSDYSRNDYSKAIEHCNKALEYIDKIEDTYDKHRVLTMIANEHKNLGQYEISLKFSQESLLLNQSPDFSTNQKWRDYETVTATFEELKLYSTAAVFQKEALALTRIVGDYHNEQVSNVYLAEISMLQGNFDEADGFINESIRLAGNLTDDEARQKALAHSKFLQGSLKRLEGKYEESIPILNEAAAFYDNSQFQFDKYNTHREKFLSYLQTQDENEIQKELNTILDIFRFHRKKILEEQERNSFFDNKQDVYDLAIEYEFSRQRFDTAFDYSEESRARSLLDLQKSDVNISTTDDQPEIFFSPDVTEPLKLSRIQAEMPDTVQIVQYAVLNKKTVIWLVTKNGLITGKTEISSEELQNKISAYLELLSKNTAPEDQRKLSAELYDMLISPIREKLDTKKEIFFIPDKILSQLPFATLFSGKYLIEDFIISYAPSANVFLSCSKKAEKIKNNKSEKLLSIGNPSFSRTVFSSLQKLPAAKQEAESIAGFYDDDAVVFTEKEATKAHIKEIFPKADVVHFAGHYMFDENNSMRSGLIVAGNEKNDSEMTNFDIIGQKLSHTRLIVLSACQTGVGRYYNGEGMIGAARTFLAAGVPLVVASQWKVDSDASSKLMIDFHRYRKNKNLSTPAALRLAQIEMMQNEKYREPYFWAAFINLGGYSEF